MTDARFRNRIVGTGEVSPADLAANPLNWRVHPASQAEALDSVLARVGWVQTIIVNRQSNTIVDGHLRVKLALQYDEATVPVTYVDLSDEEERLILATFDPLTGMAETDTAALASLLESLDFESAALAEHLETLAEADALGEEELGDPPSKTPGATLADRFLVPPFSVLDARQGYWQDRKRQWLGIGIQSELGRGENLVPNGGAQSPEHDGAWMRRSENGLLGFSEQARSHYAAPGGSARPATKLGPDGKTRRGDGHGRAFGQDLMRGEHVVGGNNHVHGVLMRSDSGNDPTYYYQKRAIERQLGRDLTTEEFQRDYYQGPNSYQSGTSIFDPVLCELVYRWFCPASGSVLDPFAGGSVRGIVAAALGRAYTGIELRADQVEANAVQWDVIGPRYAGAPAPLWITGDSRAIAPTLTSSYDLLFSCPPYADLERYSDDPRDLSTMGYAEFLANYRVIIQGAAAHLNNDRFAVFVVGDVRDEKGRYRNFVSDTIAAFHEQGLRLYNDAILVTAIGSLAIRAGRQFAASRKLGKTHQNVLVFVKGDPSAAVKAIGPVAIDDAVFESVEE